MREPPSRPCSGGRPLSGTTSSRPYSIDRRDMIQSDVCSSLREAVGRYRDADRTHTRYRKHTKTRFTIIWDTRLDLLTYDAVTDDTPAGFDAEPEGLRLLAQGPLARASMHGHEVWLALDHPSVRRVLSDPRFSRAAAARPGGPVANPAGYNPDLLTSMDPPRHTTARRLIAQAFTPDLVRRLRPLIQHLVDGLLDDLAAHGKPADLIPLLAEPLPVMVICELLGVPAEDRPRIRHWAGRLMADTAYPPAEIAEAFTQVNTYLDALIARRRDDPDGALISALIKINDRERVLAPPELTSNIQLLLIAGHETTVNQIGNSVVSLFRHPHQAALLRDDPNLVPRAVDELLRYSRLLSSALPRVATQDVDLGGATIAAGDVVVPLIAVANHDPHAFPDPDRLDVTRSPAVPHLAFGHGPHYCPGAHLAQLELHTALGTLLRRFPTLAPATDLDALRWKPGLVVRALHALPITW